jgi:hypothetical protein
MMSETTHRYDRERGHLVQIVSPERLRQILLADGDDCSRPKDFGPLDEWELPQETLDALAGDPELDRSDED